MVQIKEMPEMSYETFIPISSKNIIGKTFRDVEREFGIKVDHYPKSQSININNKQKSASDTKIYAGMELKVVGEWDKIDSFREAYNLF